MNGDSIECHDLKELQEDDMPSPGKLSLAES